MNQTYKRFFGFTKTPFTADIELEEILVTDDIQAVFSRCRFEQCSFRQCEFDGTAFWDSIIVDCNFHECSLL